MTHITSKPDHGEVLTPDGRATRRFQEWVDDVDMGLNENLLGAQVTLTSYTVLTLPDVTSFPGLIFVSDEAGGAVPAFSDGTNWRRVTDRTIVS